MFRSARACCNITADTSHSHSRSGVAFAAVNRFDNSLSETYGSSASNAVFRAASASLNTTRAHPNTRASDSR
ncbi:hypothetical protein NS506_05995 [Nocardia seriolae]|uniref:Uncharacterized protein n=1 Tax=Nocardia seriolae TaxID=37332 RepID=A0ABC8B196_9NOCA|nr:hypothetical protein NS506_05995 [Nocardia seriolae]OJF79580.1 hypothetical protein NS14008_10680 [Nocardia seriolae]